MQPNGKPKEEKPKLTELFRLMVSGLRQAADALETIAQRLDWLSARFDAQEAEEERRAEESRAAEEAAADADEGDENGSDEEDDEGAEEAPPP